MTTTTVQVLDVNGTTVQVVEDQCEIVVQSPGPQGPLGPTGPTGPTGPADSIEFDGGAPDTVYTSLVFDGGGVA